MKLYLSSLIPQNLEELIGLIDTDGKLSVAIIPNAWDTYPKERRVAEANSCFEKFTKSGFEISVLDLTKANKESVRTTLKGKSLVWVMGGNTFHLNYLMYKSGFSDEIKSLLEAGLVYGGESAGAVVAGKTLHGIENLDDPKDSLKVIWNGLCLVDYGIIPHWGLEKYGAKLSQAKKTMEKYGIVVTITNDDRLVIDEKS